MTKRLLVLFLEKLKAGTTMSKMNSRDFKTVSTGLRRSSKPMAERSKAPLANSICPSAKLAGLEKNLRNLKLMVPNIFKPASG